MAEDKGQYSQSESPNKEPSLYSEPKQGTPIEPPKRTYQQEEAIRQSSPWNRLKLNYDLWKNSK